MPSIGRTEESSLFNLTLSKNAAKGAAVNSRALTIEELQHVGGALMDDYYDEYDGGGGWGGDYGGDYGGASEYFYDYGYTDYSWSNPQTEYFDNGIQTVYVTGTAWTDAQQTQFNSDFSTAFNDCWNNTTSLDGVSMAIGGTFAESVLTGAGWVGAGEFFSGLNDVTQAIQDFNERAGEVGYRYAYCEYKAQDWAYNQQP